MYINNMYVLLVASICLFYYGIFKVNFKDKKQKLWKVIILQISIFCFLIAIAKMMSLENTLFYQIIIFGGALIMFALFTYGAWEIRKIPEKRVAALTWLIGMPIIILFCLIAFIVI